MRKKFTRVCILTASACLTFAQSEKANENGYQTDSIQQIQDIVVTGTNLATDNNKLPYSISILSNKEIEESGESKVLSILSGRIPKIGRAHV